MWTKQEPGADRPTKVRYIYPPSTGLSISCERLWQVQRPPPFQFYMIRYVPRASSDKPFLSEAGIRRGALFHSPIGRKLKAGNIVSRPTRLHYRQLLPHLNGSSMSCSQRRVHTLKLFLIDSRAEDRMLSAQPVHLWLLEFISGLRGYLSLNFRYFKIDI